MQLLRACWLLFYEIKASLPTSQGQEQGFRNNNNNNKKLAQEMREDRKVQVDERRGGNIYYRKVQVREVQGISRWDINDLYPSKKSGSNLFFN